MLAFCLDDVELLLMRGSTGQQWADSEDNKLTTNIHKGPLPGSQLTAYAAGSRAMTSWTRDLVEIQTSDRAQIMQYVTTNLPSSCRLSLSFSI
jgi:hypothetical protein